MWSEAKTNKEYWILICTCHSERSEESTKRDNAEECIPWAGWEAKWIQKKRIEADHRWMLPACIVKTPSTLCGQALRSGWQKVNLRDPQRATVCRWLKFPEDAISAESGKSARDSAAGWKIQEASQKIEIKWRLETPQPQTYHNHNTDTEQFFNGCDQRNSWTLFNQSDGRLYTFGTGRLWERSSKTFSEKVTSTVKRFIYHG